MKINRNNIHCYFLKKYILDDWDELRSSLDGIEIFRWRLLYWLELWKENIKNCSDCSKMQNSITENFSKAGIKLELTFNQKTGKFIFI